MFVFEYRKNLRSTEKRVLILYFLLVQSASWRSSYVLPIGWDGIVSKPLAMDWIVRGIESQWG